MKTKTIFIIAIALMCSSMAWTQKENAEIQSAVKGGAMLKSNVRQSPDVKRIVPKHSTNCQLAENESYLPAQLQKSQNNPARIKQNTAAAWTIKCDSIVDKTSSGARTEKTEFGYDNKGNIILETYYDGDETTNQWIRRSRHEYTYDNNGKNTLYIYSFWDTDNNKWTGSRKNEYTYDSNGKRTLIISYNWDMESSKWIGSWKEEYTYDNNGKRTLFISYYWNTESSKWIGNGKSEYTYDSNGRLSFYISYYWDWGSNKWVGNWKSEYTYDSNGRLSFYISYNWNWESNKWVGNWKHEHAYDNNGNEISTIYYDWDIMSNKWVGSNKYEYAYDSNGNLTLEIDYNWEYERWKGTYKYEADYTYGKLTFFIEYDWDETNSRWVGSEKGEYTYDSNGNRISIVKYSWDNTAGKWTGDEKYEYTWDNNYFISNLCSAASIFNSWVDTNIPTESRYYEWNIYSEQWSREYESSIIYYSPFNTSSIVNPFAVNEIKVFPNPVKDILQINIPEDISVKLYNQQGSLLLHSKEHQIDFSGFSAGIYIVDINGEKLKIVKL